jgi:CRISPR-associated endonuclease Cas3-HD
MTTPDFLARPTGSGGSASLRRHLETTQAYAAELTTDDSELQEVAKTAAYLHDFGKVTEWFQSYIRKVDRAGPDERVQLTREQQRRKQHARISAYATEYALMKNDIEAGWRVPAFVAVAKHHQPLPDTRAEIRRTTNLNRRQNQDRFQLVQKQLKNIHETAPDVADELLANATDGDGSLVDFIEYIVSQQPHETLSAFDVNDGAYDDIIHLFGILVSADKLASAGLDVIEAPGHSPKLINEYIQELPTADSRIQKRLNQFRETARLSVLDNLSAFEESDSSLATITLPTGFGKTLTGLHAALQLSEGSGRVVYALPYTSILDQVDEIVRELLDATPNSPEYTLHHHLSETRTLPPETRVDTDAAELLAQTWRAPLVLTTFVQLFESLAGPTNKQSIKIPALENTTILLDEPQALPKRWWRFIAWTVDMLVREFDATIILMTATQPRLLNELPYATEPYELVEEPNQYFEFLGDHPRIQYQLDSSVIDYLDQPRSAAPKPIEDAVSQLVDTDAGSILSVGNTVASVDEQGQQLLAQLENAVSLNGLLADLYEDFPSAEALSDQLGVRLHSRATAHDGPAVGILTSRLRPIDRTILLKTIRELLDSDTRLYVASTQLIEAGVDVSFERAYRDLAPLPSLIQTAGRCNREFGGETAEVVIWRLASPEYEIATGDIVYRDGYDLLDPTRQALDDIHADGRITEQTMAQDGGERYFQLLHSETKPGDRELVADAEAAKFASLREESLIPDEREQVDIVVGMTENERNLFDAHERLVAEGRYRRLRGLRNALQQRQVSVPCNEATIEATGAVPLSGQSHLYYVDARGDESIYQLRRGGRLSIE